MEETQKEEMWNFKCSHCEWRGVAQELIWKDSIAEYTCPECLQQDIEDKGWHKGNIPLIKIKRHK
jgi:Zn finger protein HypA/HybF involved in hydrogenase expression